MHRFAPIFFLALPSQQKRFQSFGACYIPAPSKRYRGGEDAHFVNATSMIVADGVSQWFEDDGIDAGLYALQLVEELSTKPAHEAKMTVQGSATFCVAKMNGECLDVSYLGDSGLHIYRPGTHDTKWPIFKRVIATSDECGYLLVHATKPMRHEDDRPFQLGSHAEADGLKDVAHESFVLQSGDLVVMGSDGLFDVIGPDVSHILSTKDFDHPHKIAWQLGTLASHAAETLGDLDDITVLVGRVE